MSPEAMSPKEQENRIIGWLGVTVAVVALLAALLLPGTQMYLCRNGIRLACDPHDMKIENVEFSQVILKSADDVVLLDVLASHVSTGARAPNAFRCDENEQWVEEGLDRYNKRQAQDSHPLPINRNYLMADMTLSYPPSETPTEIRVDLLIKRPPGDPQSNNPLGIEASPILVEDLPTVEEHVRALSDSRSGTCRLIFMVGGGALYDEVWPLGRYYVSIDVHGVAELHGERSFEFTNPAMDRE